MSEENLTSTPKARKRLKVGNERWIDHKCFHFAGLIFRFHMSLLADLRETSSHPQNQFSCLVAFSPISETQLTFRTFFASQKQLFSLLLSEWNHQRNSLFGEKQWEVKTFRKRTQETASHHTLNWSMPVLWMTTSFLMAKVKMKTKDDKMMISERCFQSCGRDLSRWPS